MSAADRYTHCPDCLAEYRAGYTVCTDCGSLLVAGPSPTVEPAAPPIAERTGRVEVLRRDEPDDEGSDRFALEETPIVLTLMIREDADAFLAALDEQEIGARRGRDLGDGGLEIIVHAANLIDAQAVLVEFTGDVSLVDEIAVDPGVDDGWAVVTWVSLRDAGSRTNRLRDRGVDVRLELPADANPDASDAQAAILVPAENLETARDILGIER